MNTSTSQQVDQKGSLVDDDKLRFDFSWNGPLSLPQLTEIEQIVNTQISSNLNVYASIIPLSDAKSIKALRSVFGEKYPDPVRVISVGANITEVLQNPDSDKWFDGSIELCGGTHLSNTNEAESFLLIEESGIAKGVRRITGYTRKAAKIAKAKSTEIDKKLIELESMNVGEELNEEAKAFTLIINQSQISVVDKAKFKGRLDKVQDKIRKWYKSLLAERLKIACDKGELLAKDALSNKNEIIITRFDDVDGSISKKLIDAMKKIHTNASFFIYSNEKATNKLGLFSYVCKKHQSEGLSAKDWLDQAFAAASGQGKGGGKAENAIGNIPGGLEFIESIMVALKSYVGNRVISE
jgi:alanyl-tRNA synthetase